MCKFTIIYFNIKGLLIILGFCVIISGMIRNCSPFGVRPQRIAAAVSYIRLTKQEETLTMKKRIIALLLCLATAVTVFVGCSGKIDADSEYKGQQITMYLTDNIYDLDPANAYNNEVTRNIVNLLFDTLFTVDEKGKVKESLAESYKTETDEDGNVFMYIQIKEDARWSDNQPVTADDVVFAWKRILNPNNAYECASLLFDIKNARAYNEAEVSKDDIGLIADGKLLTIEFEKKIDFNHFLLNLTSLALAPLREDIASKNADWAKKPGIMTSSGPFKLAKVGFYKNDTIKYEDLYYSQPKVDENNKVMNDKNGNPIYIDATVPKNFDAQSVNSFILERNLYYYRNAEDGEKLDKSVTPYRIIVDCGMTDAEILEAYNAGIITYVGDIPMSIRKDVKGEAKTYSSLSTNSLYLNQNAEIKKLVGYENGDKTKPLYETVKLFANKAVRQALSLAIDREAIANGVVFAEVATGLVPTGVYDTNSAKKLFRDASTAKYDYLAKNADKAAQILAAQDITPSDYYFTLTVSSYDDVHTYVAKSVVEAWKKLGFNVELNIRGTIANNDFHKDVSGIPGDLCDDLWAEDLRRGSFEAIILDIVAPSTDPFSVLAPYAKQFSGQKMDMSNAEDYKLTPHVTGYDSKDYNDTIEAIYNNKDIASRSANLHKAEDILMEDMPVIPIIFNKAAYLINEDVLDLNSKTGEYYYHVTFDKMSIKKYEEYELSLAKYICGEITVKAADGSTVKTTRFDQWKQRPDSYFGSNFSGLTVQEFLYTNSNYFYLFKGKRVDWTEKVKDSKGKLVVATDANGNKLAETDENGEIETNKKGDPKYIYAETELTSFAPGYEWMPINPKLEEEETEAVTEVEADTEAELETEAN